METVIITRAPLRISLAGAGTDLPGYHQKHPGLVVSTTVNHYVYSILTGYTDPPAGFKMQEGLNYNRAFPGHQIAMPKPLNEDQVTYSDGTKATLDQEARDVVTFLTWTAEPELAERKRLGIKVVLFLILLTAMLYAIKRKVWADVH